MKKQLYTYYISLSPNYKQDSIGWRKTLKDATSFIEHLMKIKKHCPRYDTMCIIRKLREVSDF